MSIDRRSLLKQAAAFPLMPTVAVVGFVLPTVWRTPPLLVVIISALGGVALALAYQ